MRKALFAAAMLLALASCTSIDKELGGLSRIKDSGIHRFHATLEQSASETKVYADEDLKLLWNAGDLITVFNQNTYNSKFEFMGEDGDNSADFDDVTPSGLHSGNPLNNIYAVYPYARTNKINNAGTHITLTMPAEQLYREHSFGVGANTMVAVTDNSFLAFKNVGGYLQLKLYGDNVKVSSITIKGNNGEKIAGKASVAVGLGVTPSVTMDGTATDEVTLVCDPPVQIGASATDYTDFSLVVPPTTFSRGFTITVRDELGGTFAKTTTKSLTIARSTMEYMSALKVVPNYDTILVEFEDANFKAYCVENFDDNGDEEISLTEALTIESIDVYTDDIASLGGIELMLNLQSLRAIASDENHAPDMPGGQLTEVDLSGNPLLEICELSGNEIQSIDISMLPNLRRFHANNTPLKSIDFHNNPLLYWIMLNGTYQLESIPEMRHLNLQDLHLSGCAQKLTDSDYMRSFPGLCSLNFSEYPGTDIDLSLNTQLQNIWALNCPNLEVLDLTSTEVKNLYITGCPQLEKVIVPAGTVFETLEKDDHTAIIYDGLVVNKYLTFTSEGTTTLSLRNINGNAPILYYSFDATTWALWNYSELTFTNDSPLYICGDNPEGLSKDHWEGEECVDTSTSRFISSGDTFAISGDIMSLINKDIDVRVIPSDGCFHMLFYGCPNLTKAPELPATTLAKYCYGSMFEDCTSLMIAPELPATTLTDWCYTRMFDNCTSLTNAPELPAMTLALGCYQSMFDLCTNLTDAPELPATILADWCYSNMFEGCSNLTNAPRLPASALTDYCYIYMFSDCTSLTSAPLLSASELAEGCYEGMFVNCTDLTVAPELPATTLTEACYLAMFSRCTSLISAPDLPATTLAQSCYRNMFKGCTSLSHLKCLATDISADGCVVDWLDGVSPTGTFIKAESMNGWPVGASGIPEGWTVQDTQ